MKKTIQYSTLILLIGLLNACHSGYCYWGDTDPRGNTETDAVFVRLVDSEFATRNTNGSSEHIPDGTFLAFNDGYLFLVTEAGIIRQRYTISPTSLVDVDVTNRIICRNALGVGVTIPVVSGDVRRVVIVGNYDSSATAMPGVGANISAVGNRGLDIISQYNALNVNLFGEENVVMRTTGVLYYEYPTGSGIFYRIWETTEPLFLEPTVARFEINSIRGAGDIASFDIEGIFIDNFYRNARVNGEITSATRTTSGIATTFTEAGYAFDADNGLHTWYGGSRGSATVNSLIVTPNDPRPIPNLDRAWVWSYQVFARSHDHTRNVRQPHIVVRLSNITLTDGTQISDHRFVTVGSFTDIDNSTTLQHIFASHIYRLEMIEFDSRALSRYPNVNLINANVRISVDDWDRNVIRPTNPLRQPQLQPMTLDFDADIPFLLGMAMGGTWNFQYRWYYAAYDPFDAAPPFGSNEWKPIGGNLQSLPAGTRTIGTENLWIRRVVYDNNETIYTAALMSVPLPTLDVDPPIWVFMGIGTQIFNVTTNYLSWEVDVTTVPFWATFTETGDTFTLEVDHAYTGSSRTAVLTVTAGTATQFVTVTQIGDDVSDLALPNAFVGAFWRNDQWGERLIRFSHTGDWIAMALDDWIILDRNLSWIRPAAESTVNMTTHDHLHRLNPLTARSAVRGTNNIYFRIGLTGTNPTTEVCPTTNRAMPRYGRVAIMHNNNQSVHIIWVRQGEAPDYLMRPIDLMDNGAPRPARRFTPFNLTAYTLDVPVLSQADHAAGMPGNRSRFTQYPSQTGAFWQHISEGTQLRMPHSPAISFTPRPGWMNPTNNTWANIGAIVESCPPGWRRSGDGIAVAGNMSQNTDVMIRNSEMRQSLFLVPRTSTNGSYANSVAGLYADGFFDRRPITTSVTGAAHSTVAGDDPYAVAHRGRLMFNPYTGASIFFPFAGRLRDTNGEPQNIGSWGIHWTSARPASMSGWSLRTAPGYSSMFSPQNHTAASVRCVVAD